MALTWFGTVYTQFLWEWIYSVTGVWPSQNSAVVGSSIVTVGASYTTVVNVSSGPYVVAAVRADPGNSTTIDIRVTIDGSLVIEKTSVAATVNNFVIGSYFDDQVGIDHAPVLARSSLKIEARTLTSSQSVDWLYAGYSL